LLQRKEEKYRALKKSLLKNLFPEKGQDIPILRFKDFNEDWQQDNLGNIVQLLSGFTGNSELKSGKYKLTRIETIADGYINEERLGYSNQKPDVKYLLNKGDILYSNINSINHIGKVALVKNNNSIYHGINLIRIVPKKIYPYFLFYSLNLDIHKIWAQSHANMAVNQASINKTELSKQQFAFSSNQEQNAISNMLLELDNLIMFLEKKIMRFKSLKNFLLQNMFI
uniref:restriction endonuclease subunit S n=1 Tax=Lactobacillus agrestimuris TaxID=2941328 RepID=UPI002042D88E